MRHYLNLSTKQLKTQKMSTIFIILAIVMSTALLTAIGQSIGLLQGLFQNQAKWLNGNSHIQLTVSTEDEVAQIFNNDELTEIGVSKHLGVIDTTKTTMILGLYDYDEFSVNSIQKANLPLEDGRYPVTANEIALTPKTLKILEYPETLGTTLNLPMYNVDIDGVKYEFEAEFVLTGILKDLGVSATANSINGMVGTGAMEKYLPPENYMYLVSFKVQDLDNFQPIVNQIVDDLNITRVGGVQYSHAYLDSLGVDYVESMSSSGFGVSLPIVIVGALILLSAGFVVYNIFKISILKEMKDYGVLRAIGAEPSQIYKIVLGKVVIFILIATPIGGIIGVFMSEGVISAMVSMLNPSIFMVDTTDEVKALLSSSGEIYIGFILVAILITSLFSILSVIPTARYASKVSPKVAMSGVKDVKITRKNRKVKDVGAHFENYFAKLNLMRNRGKTIVTILSMFLAITLFIGLNSFIEPMNPANDMLGGEKGDYSLTSRPSDDLNYNNGLPQSEIDRIIQDPNVADAPYIKHAYYNRFLYNDPENLEGLKPLELDFELPKYEDSEINADITIFGISDSFVELGLTDMSKEDKVKFLNGEGCIYQPNGFLVDSPDLEVGKSITINGTTLEILHKGPVLMLTGGGVVSTEIVVNERLFEQLTGDTLINEVYIHLAEGADIASVESLLNDIQDNNSYTSWLSFAQYKIDAEQSFKQIKYLAIGFIAVITFISGLNIFNTMYTNIYSRIKEIGVQRALGMDRLTIRRIFILEGLYYGGIASLFGGTCGYLITIILNMSNGVRNPYVVPVVQIAIAVAFTLIVCYLSTVISLRQISRLSIVQSIENVE
ncbi:MAG: hypothetical protein ATN34_03850 [Epulopiscium sp. Nele67-Bin002]|nr:MAG: hypothetical protein ATN34_03850 [Epulopiscium sp. Nele67-Bin002]